MGEPIELAVAGRPNAEIASKLGISCRTVEKHLEHVYEQLAVPNRAAAAALIGSGDPDETSETVATSDPAEPLDRSFRG